MCDKVSAGEKKLLKAFATVADLVDKTAAKLKSGDDADTNAKKLKELTVISKELYSIVKNTEQKPTENDGDKVHIVFMGEGEEWAK